MVNYGQEAKGPTSGFGSKQWLKISSISPWYFKACHCWKKSYVLGKVGGCHRVWTSPEEDAIPKWEIRFDKWLIATAICPRIRGGLMVGTAHYRSRLHLLSRSSASQRSHPASGANGREECHRETTREYHRRKAFLQQTDQLLLGPTVGTVLMKFVFGSQFTRSCSPKIKRLTMEMEHDHFPTGIYCKRSASAGFSGQLC